MMSSASRLVCGGDGARLDAPGCGGVASMPRRSKAAMIDAAISAPPTRLPSRTVLPIKFAHDLLLEGQSRRS